MKEIEDIGRSMLKSMANLIHDENLDIRELFHDDLRVFLML